MPVAGPYYFSWVDEGAAFDPDVHNVMDEYVFSFRRILKEGDMPVLELVIRNPHIGLLNSSRKQWAWFARDSASTAGIVPLFYGRLIAAPTDIFKEKMTIRLVAWPVDYPQQRQRLAEEIKASGPYDPVFIDVTKRDDPDTVLEAISGLWHIDPVTHEVSVSDILNGEDGNVDVTADEHLYDGMNAEFDQTSTLTNILMVATVSWNQTGQGYIDMGTQTIASYAGDAIISQWPKQLQSLGGGYTVASSHAIDANGVAAMQTGTTSITWTNKEKEHSDGDQLSQNVSITAPSGAAISSGTNGFDFLGTMLTYESQTGILDPFATDGNGDPSPTNIPAHTNATFAWVPGWSVKTSLVLAYRDLDRRRTERVQMLLQSDLQSIIVRPEVEQNSETIVKQGADVGIPIIKLLNWTTVAGQSVELDTIVFPDNPSLPSQRTAQICVSAGVAGLVEPGFSDVPGVTTNDNTVVWASLGTPAPADTAFDWAANTNIGYGSIILPRRPLYLSYRDLTFASVHQTPPAGTEIALGAIVQASNGSFQVCTLSGLSLLREPAFSTTRGDVTLDGSANWTCIGSSLPDGKTHFLCVQPGQTGPQWVIPQFDNANHAQTIDGTVIWSAIGTGDIPAGGTPGDVWARSYFATARGHNSVEYLIAIMRARARLKARAVTIDFTPVDPFGLGLLLTCRKTVSLHDTRLGGGVAIGKVKFVEHGLDGRTGREICRAQIGCAIGKDNVIDESPGTASYVDGYVEGYRVFNGTVKVISSASDVGYTPPIFATNDDGLVFPLTKAQIVVSEGIRGSHSGQSSGVQGALAMMAQSPKWSLSSLASVNVTGAEFAQMDALTSNSVQRATSLNPIWYEAILKPLTGWQFNDYYNVTLTKLTCQKGIDLEGVSTP